MNEAEKWYKDDRSFFDDQKKETKLIAQDDDKPVQIIETVEVPETIKGDEILEIIDEGEGEEEDDTEEFYAVDGIHYFLLSNYDYLKLTHVLEKYGYTPSSDDLYYLLKLVGYLFFTR